jgi:hypothetical protein
MKTLAALAGGMAGTLTVAAVHEALRRVFSNAPRMDVLDMELIQKGLQGINRKVPERPELQRWAVGGELVCDTAYYSLVGMGSRKNTWMRGIALGLAAGITAVVLPKPLGLPDEPSSKNTGTQVMTVGLYLLGGLASAVISQLVDNTGRTANRP